MYLLHDEDLRPTLWLAKYLRGTRSPSHGHRNTEKGIIHSFIEFYSEKRNIASCQQPTSQDAIPVIISFVTSPSPYATRMQPAQILPKCLLSPLPLLTTCTLVIRKMPRCI